MRTTFIVYIIGALALAGIAPLAGFWSKDEILAHGLGNEGLVFITVFVLLLLAAFCTAFYMGRQLKMVFFGKPRHDAANHAKDSPAIMTVPLIILAGLTILGGLLNLPFFSSGAAERVSETQDSIQLVLEEWLEHALESIELSKKTVGEVPILELPETPVTLELNVAGMSLLLALLGLGLSMLVVYRRKPERAEDPDPLERTPIWWFSILPINTLYMSYFVPAFNRLAHWLATKLDWEFWHDFFHDRIIRDGYIGVANFLNRRIDAAIIDDGLVNGSAKATGWLAMQLRKIQTGYVRNYALSVFLGVVVLIIYIIFLVN
jgi:NADH-quinone oxidoreductase subunit L